jgi:hypothetical protein
MTISLPGSSRGGLFGRKKKKALDLNITRTKAPLEGEQLARLFDKSTPKPKAVKPAKMNASETRDRDRLSSLRGALYAKD